MVDKIKVTIVTPEQKLIEDYYEMVQVPSFEGEVGILPGHAPLLAMLGSGVVTCTRAQRTEKFAIKKGFVEVEPEAVIIITKEAIRPENVDRKRIERNIEELQNKIGAITSSTQSEEFITTSEQLEWLKAQLKLVKEL